jgi:hypothetical protein
VKEIQEQGKDSTLDCNKSAALAPGEPTAGSAPTGAYAAQAYVPTSNRNSFNNSNVVGYTVIDECKLTVTRGLARKAPHPTFRVGQPFPCEGAPADQLALRSAFGDTFDLHGCAALTNRSWVSYPYVELDLVGTSRATPESNCAPHGKLQAGSLSLSTVKRGLAHQVMAISANWGMVIVPNAPTKIVVTYDNKATTLHVVHGSAVLARRTSNEKRDGPALYGTKDAGASCRPKTSACILRGFVKRFERDGARLVLAGRSSTTAGGRVPTPPR